MEVDCHEQQTGVQLFRALRDTMTSATVDAKALTRSARSVSIEAQERFILALVNVEDLGQLGDRHDLLDLPSQA